MNEINKQCISMLAEDIYAGNITIGIVLDVLTEKFNCDELATILSWLDELGYEDINNLLILEKYNRNCIRQQNIEYLEKCLTIS